MAFSHAALGSAFYYGIFGHDLTVASDFCRSLA
jgi:hypothetical protein